MRRHANVLVVADEYLRSHYLYSLLDCLIVKSVRYCDDGIDALAAIREAAPHVIIASVNMSPMNELEFVRTLHSDTHPGRRRIPVVFLRDQSNDKSFEHLAAMNAVSILDKKPQPGAFQATIDLALAMAQSG